MRTHAASTLLLLVGFVSISHAHQKQDTTQSISASTKLEARINELEKRVASLEAQLKALTILEPTTSHPQLAGTRRAEAKQCPLILDDWGVMTGQGDFGQAYYGITLKLRNSGSKPIKLIEASVQFTDLLDAKLYRIKVTPDINIASGTTHKNFGKYPINQFISEQCRMRDIKKADIKATLDVTRIVFTDNTVLKVSR